MIMNKNKSSHLLYCICLNIVFLLFLSPISAQAPSSPTDQSTNEGNYILEHEVGYNPTSQNSAIIYQEGVDNDAEINQVREIGQRGLNAQVIQDGYNNETLVKQHGGAHNFTSVQYGFDNYISSEMNGANHQVYLEQDGQGNSIHQELNGTTEGVFILTQRGADHEIYHTREGDVPLLEIHQTGFGAKVTVTQQ